ncbi:MAG: hypothetical protein GXX91_04520, partial [Verrucomicrobiaceae bacterium]|nr:hypothetical protein [Verrucomicrobiaceae bacterium]
AENERRTPKFSLSALLSSAFSPPPFSFLLSPFSFLLPPSLLRPLRGRNNAFTLIELVAALSLFVVILGILMTVLNSATEMWSASHSQKKEQTAALAITDLIADDLVQAVSVNINDYPIFILESLPDIPGKPDPSKVYTILGFVRHASVHSPVPLSEKRRSIDAVFYTYYDNALLRHVFPIVTSGFNTSESIGKLVDGYKNKLTKDEHDKILKFARNEPGATYPDVWQWQLLAERADIIIAATLPRTLIRMNDPGKYPNALPSAPDPDPDLHLPPLPVSRLYSDVLPDQVDIRQLRLCDQQDWAAYEPLRDKDTPKDRYLKAFLGTLVSRRITLPQAGGSRLP